MKFVRYSQLWPEYGISYSRQHLNRLVKQGRFPAPKKLNPGSGPNGAIVWTDEQIEDHIAAVTA